MIPADQFQAALSREVDTLSRLVDALQQEQDCLARRDGDGLEKTLPNKYDLLAQLEQNTRVRESLLGKAGMRPGKVAMDSYIQQHAHQLMPLWQQFRDLAAQCKQMNLINGNIVEQTRRHTERALAILQGRSLDEQTYGRRGENQYQTDSGTSIKV